MPAVHGRRHVNVDDVTVLQALVAGNAVADYVIDRDTHRLGEAAIAQRRRDAAAVMDEFGAKVVEVLGKDAGHHVGGDEIESLGGQGLVGLIGACIVMGLLKSAGDNS